MAIYAYADETIFTINQEKNEFALGCGILISKNEITQKVIDEALENLAKDNEFNAQKDQRTIDNNFFHASEDSKNGHSYLCHSINKYIKGIFDYTFKDNVEQKDLLKSNFTEKIFDRCLSNSTLELFITTDEVFLIIENRNKLNEQSILKWKNILYKLYEGATYNLPFYKTFYPKLSIILKDKKEPGLQIVDFLIWASNRTKTIKPDNIWQERLNYTTWYSYDEEQNFHRVKYYLNHYPNDEKGIGNYPVKFEKPNKWEEYLNAYIHIEKFLVFIDKSDFSEKNIHLFEDFNRISLKLKNKNYHLKSDDINQIGSIFLRLFDTLPIYSHINNNDNDSWTVLLHAKYFASMLVRVEKNHFVSTQNEILRWRYQMQTKHPDKFYHLIYNANM